MRSNGSATLAIRFAALASMLAEEVTTDRDPQLRIGRWPQYLDGRRDVLEIVANTCRDVNLIDRSHRLRPGERRNGTAARSAKRPQANSPMTRGLRSHLPAFKEGREAGVSSR
jgi:hypothetical protein